jgi:pimeloyl-ACP methyl ester carboxylesterase
MTRAQRLLGSFLIAAGAAAAVYSPYITELSRTRRTANTGGRLIKTTAGPIEYAEMGNGTPLLSVHGAGGGYDQGLSNVADLVGDGFRVIAPSRFGYLRTPIPTDSSPAAQADAHAALLSSLKIRRAVVVGVSAGARSAVELAARYPDEVAALVLIVPGTYSPTTPVAIDASRASKFALWLVENGADFGWWAIEKIAPSTLVRFLGVKPELLAAAPKSEQARVMALMKSIEPLSLRLMGIKVDSAPVLIPPPLDRIRAPTLVISARDDLFNTLPAAEYAAAMISGAKLVVYDDGGHLLVGRQTEAHEAILNFLEASGLTPASRTSNAMRMEP